MKSNVVSSLLTVAIATGLSNGLIRPGGPIFHSGKIQKTYPQKGDPQKPDQKPAPQKADPQKTGPVKAGLQPEPPTVQIDPSLRPRMRLVAGIGGGPDRPLATVTDAKGNQADFVVNEMLVATNDMAELDGLVRRWSGKIIRTLDFESIKLKGGPLRGAPKLHLIKVDPTGADPGHISKDLRTVDPNCRGKLRMSSEAGRQLLAAVASEAAAQRMRVSLNWVMYDSGLTDGTTAENPTGDGGYNPNAFRWPYMNQGSEQDIGVGAAWQALAAADRLRNRVKIMVTDSGFLVNADLPDRREHFGVGDWGTRSFIPCEVGEGSCRWHGTDVVAVAMAKIDNRFGIAGPAGPVAELIALGRTSDFFGFFASLIGNLEALAEAPDIIDISATARIPAAAAIFADPLLSVIYDVLRRAGTLVFASAGNDGQDVDAEDCFGFCWEEAAWLPCEASSVICVGGMGWDTARKDPGSNWGSKSESASVDIYGPFVVWGYKDPKLGDYSATKIYGTSYSAPFVAGVAALVWAADPRLSATQVWETMQATAHRGGVFPYSHPDLRINAFAAVRRALGGTNSPPLISLSLSGGSSPRADLNRGVTLVARTGDAEDGTPCCTVNWNLPTTYSTDSGRSVVMVFNTVGSRNVVATATDRGGATQSASLTVNVVNTAPAARIEQPVRDSDVFEGADVRLLGSATDRNEGPGPGPGNLACGSLTWTSSNTADRFPVHGCDTVVRFAGTGRRTLTLAARDPQGALGVDSVDINVRPRPSNYPPTISLGVLPPFNYEAGYRWDQLIAVSASAIDPERNVPLTFRWTATSYYPDPDSSTIFGNAVISSPGTVLGNLNWTPSRTPSLLIPDCVRAGSYSGQVVRLTLEATDSLGNTSTARLPDIKVYRCIFR